MAMFLDNSEQFEKVKNMMPELITEFKTDLSTEDNKLIREFFVLPDRKVSLGGSVKPRFIYYEDEHKGLRNKIDILENHGFIIDVTPGNTPIYRMTEEFVELIMKYVNKSKQLCITQDPIFEEDQSNIIELLKKDYLLKTEDSLKEETAGIVQDFISRGLYNSTACTSKQLQAHFDYINKLLDHILELLEKDFADIPLKQIKEKLFTITDEEYKKLLPIANSHLVNAGLAQPDILKTIEQQINNKNKKVKQTIETRLAISEKQRAKIPIISKEHESTSIKACSVTKKTLLHRAFSNNFIKATIKHLPYFGPYMFDVIYGVDGVKTQKKENESNAISEKQRARPRDKRGSAETEQEKGGWGLITKISLILGIIVSLLVIFGAYNKSIRKNRSAVEQSEMPNLPGN